MKKKYTFILILCISLYSFGQDAVYTGTLGGNWNNTANWTGALLPNASGTTQTNIKAAVIDAAFTTQQFRVASDFTSDPLLLQDGLATATLTLSYGPTISAGDTVTIDGLVYTAVSGTKSDNTEFSIDGAVFPDAIALVESINADDRVGTVGGIKAYSDGNLVILVKPGTAANAITVAENSDGITASAATLSGGTDTAAGELIIKVLANNDDGILLNTDTAQRMILDSKVTINSDVSAARAHFRNEGNAGNVIEFGPNSILNSTGSGFTQFSGASSDHKFVVKGKVIGTKTIFFNTATTVYFEESADLSEFNAQLVPQNTGNIVFNTKQTVKAKRFQANGSGSTITFNQPNISDNLHFWNSNNGRILNLVVNRDQNFGYINFKTNSSIINLTIGENADNITFFAPTGSGTVSQWTSAATLNINNFREGVVRFGANDTALTQTELDIITIDGGAKVPGQFKLSSTGYLYRTSTRVYNGAWSSDPIASDIGSDNIVIESGSVSTTGTTTTTGDVTLLSSAELTIASGTTLNAGSINVNSGASLVTVGAPTITGTVNYKRFLNSSNWYLVSSPVSGETMTDMNSNNSFVTNASSKISFAPYDNNQASANNRWAYFDNTATDGLVDGKGYSTKLSAEGTLSFSGSMNTGSVDIALTQGAGNNFNLIGNPYTAYVSSGTFLSDNTAELAQQNIYVWDQSNNVYDTYTSAQDLKLAPGQGFFVEANSTNTVSFTEAMQSHESTDTFQKTAKSEITLNLSDSSQSRYAKIYYAAGNTKGFDNGYDGKLFGAVSHPFAIYTNLLEDNVGEQYQIQSLPKTEMESLIIPVGINAQANNEITITATDINLPEGMMVFLEDKKTETFIRLDEANSAYKTTLTKNMSGVGRFYLHAKTSSPLSTNDFEQSTISVYKKDNSTLRIVGIPEGKLKVNIFNILGKQILEGDYNSKRVQDVALPELSQGVYVVQIRTTLGQYSKKIILE